ncbi:unnamed protein product [Leptosia nina]|uniref:L-serine deaminase n=1 Tax=Leptosia nina TaxID=320188 RepID=A0AAV1JNK0_9NEOP
MSYYGFLYSVPVNIIVPKDYPLAEKRLYKDNYAIIKSLGSDASEAGLHALSFSRDVGSNFVANSDRLDLLAGYGTLGLEILSQTDKVDAILCPVGSGGLVASILLAIKTLKPTCLIYGVECSQAPTMTRALQENRPVPVQIKQNIADSLSEMIAGKNSYNIIRGYLDKMITIDESWISRAFLKLLEREKMVVEGAAACPVAAIMAGKVPELRGKNVVVILSGGNLNMNRVPHVIERALVAEGRSLHVTATINETPGAVAKFIAKVTDAGADILSIVSDRTWKQPDVTTIKVTVVLPERVSPAQAHRCTELGADVIIHGDNIEEAKYYASKAVRDTHQMLLCADDPLVMAGLGTVGLEIITQLPETDAVIVPVTSGALLASVLVACKKLKCSCLVYGAECAKVPKMMKALQAGKPETVPIVSNLAQNLNASIVGANAFATLKGRLDRMAIDECYIAKAIVSMLERERLVADGAGVCSLAAVMQGLVPELRGKRLVCVISSGNIDSGRLARTIQRGLGATGRLLRFGVAVPDHPAGLEQLAKTISDQHAVLKSLVTEQMWVVSDVLVTWANIVVETANEEHSANLKEKLRDLYPSTRFAMDLDNKKVNVR